jgi:hypothetical protein
MTKRKRPSLLAVEYDAGRTGFSARTLAVTADAVRTARRNPLRFISSSFH